MKRRFLCFTLGLVLTFSQVVAVGAATRKEQLKEQKAQTQSQLAAQQNKINQLENQKAALAAEINQLDTDLVDVMVEIDVLKGELVTKEEEIEQTKEDLAVAEADRDEQYGAMKKRIQYLYEKGGTDGWSQLLFQANDLASFLNQAENVQKLYDSDRQSLEEFKATVQQVVDLGEQLETEKSELQEMEQEYQVQQKNLETQLEQKKATSADCTSQIAAAESQAAQYAELIRQQNAEIQKIEAEEKRAAEEAARKAAEEAARKQAAEEAARQAAAQQQRVSGSTSGSSKSTGSAASAGTASKSGSTASAGSSSKQSTVTATAAQSKSSTAKSSSASTGTGSSVAYNPTGSSVVGYATQFVGNPYVWGGTSLTNGADCSGFVMSVYAKFGVSLPHSSGAMAGVGRAVSYSEAMPGDIICYSGHVAIYMGGGAIVHASNAKDGIKISGNAAYRPIVAVRRVL